MKDSSSVRSICLESVSEGFSSKMLFLLVNASKKENDAMPGRSERERVPRRGAPLRG